MMGKIRLLDDGLVNLIAAGEVVERPASVAKELVENSLDAGARRIAVSFEAGGTTALEVTDDGEGMSREDAVLAFERHATSKIRREGDLEAIQTLGFRGEALPSIAQVSRTEVVTRRGEDLEATRLLIEGGKLVLREVTGAGRGTRVLVRDLFYNTPARRAYLKPPATEASHILEVLGRLALAAPGVQFDVASEGRPVLQTDGDGNLRGVVAALWGVDAADRMLPVEGRRASLGVRGLVSRPDLSRSNRQGQLVIAAGRPVQNLRIRYAAEEAYRGLLMKGRFPYLILILDVPPDAIDPNVHPTKWEVRFRDEAEIARRVHDAVRSALVPQTAPEARTETAAFLEPSPSQAWDDRNGNAPPLTLLGATTAAGAETMPLMPRARCQIRGLYIVAEGEEGLFLIDQHAAHERVGFERLERRDEERSAQELLSPLIVKLGPADGARLEAWDKTLEEAGFRIEGFGRGGEYAVRSVPSFLAREATPGLLTELLRQLGAGPEDAVWGRRRLWQAMAACRAAVKRGDALALPEQEALVAALWATKEPRHCPHGRPTWILVPYHALQHGLGRV